MTANGTMQTRYSSFLLAFFVVLVKRPQLLYILVCTVLIRYVDMYMLILIGTAVSILNEATRFVLASNAFAVSCVITSLGTSRIKLT